MTFTISLTTSRRMQFYYMKNTQNACDDLGEKRINKKENENHHNGNENYV